MKPIEDMTFDELTAFNSQRIHAGLLESGGKGLTSAVHYAQVITLQWRKAQDEKEAKAKKSSSKS